MQPVRAQRCLDLDYLHFLGQAGPLDVQDLLLRVDDQMVRQSVLVCDRQELSLGAVRHRIREVRGVWSQTREGHIHKGVGGNLPALISN